MARTTAVIKATIVASIQADPILSQLNSPSATALWNLFAFIVAQAINIVEQLIDIFRTEVELIASESYYGTSLWWQQQMFKFQYSTTNPQVIQVINNTIAYPIVDPTLTLITACSVFLTSGSLSIKVAQGIPGALFPLTSDQLTAASNYVNSITPAGISPTVVSLNSDKILIAADVYYLGQYVKASVLANVITAINAYISNIDFDGSIYVSKVEDAIQAVPGVKDVVITHIVVRTDSQAIVDGSVLVANSQTISRIYPLSPPLAAPAGYVIGETTGGSTFNDTINMIAA